MGALLFYSWVKESTVSHCHQMGKCLMVNNASVYCWYRIPSSESNLGGTASGFLWKEIKVSDQCEDQSITEGQNQAGILIS